MIDLDNKLPDDFPLYQKGKIVILKSSQTIEYMNASDLEKPLRILSDFYKAIKANPLGWTLDIQGQWETETWLWVKDGFYRIIKECLCK